MFINAAAWLKRYPDIRASEVGAIESHTNLAFPDALVSDPSLCVTLVQRFTVVAVERDAPAGVVDDLARLLERMRTGPAALGLLDYTFDALKPLQGKRDREEIEPVVRQALAGAPDAINKATLERVLDLVRQPERLFKASSDVGSLPEVLAPLELSPYTCAAACAVVCAEVAEAPLCYIPCIYACIQI
jgi:hypothetical protein